MDRGMIVIRGKESMFKEYREENKSRDNDSGDRIRG